MIDELDDANDVRTICAGEPAINKTPVNPRPKLNVDGSIRCQESPNSPKAIGIAIGQRCIAFF